MFVGTKDIKKFQCAVMARQDWIFISSRNRDWPNVTQSESRRHEWDGCCFFDFPRTYFRVHFRLEFQIGRPKWNTTINPIKKWTYSMNGHCWYILGTTVCSVNNHTKRSSVLWLSYRFFEEFLFHIANLSCQKL